MINSVTLFRDIHRRWMSYARIAASQVFCFSWDAALYILHICPTIVWTLSYLGLEENLSVNAACVIFSFMRHKQHVGHLKNNRPRRHIPANDTNMVGR